MKALTSAAKLKSLIHFSISRSSSTSQNVELNTSIYFDFANFAEKLLLNHYYFLIVQAANGTNKNFETRDIKNNQIHKK
jgi:hypothetical protein